MPRVIGIDPGTVSIDLCGLDDGRLFLDRSWPTTETLAEPARFVAELEAAGPLDLVAGPSGYGLPLTRVQAATEEDLRLAFLAAPGETGGIGGLRGLVRALARSALPVVLTPGVVHLPTVPAHRKVNRVDMGTAEKVCVVALAVSEQARRLGRALSNVSLVLLELGGAFTAAVAVAAGRIVDGVGGTAGPLGFRAAGALGGEVAYLAGEVPKALLFQGGAAAVAGWDETIASPERLAHPTTPAEQLAGDALVESAVKTAVALATAVPSLEEFVLSGRLAHVKPLADAIQQRLDAFAPTRVLEGFAHTAKEGAQGAALVADGLAGGVRALAARRVLWGNPPAVLARVRDPRRLARVVGKAGLPAPRVRLTRPAPGVRGGWVVKPFHSGGGDGVAVWRPGRGAPMPRRSYFQERIAGVTGSIVFAADGRRAVPLGLSRVLAGEAAFGADGFRYCGNILGAAGDPQFPADERLLDRATLLAESVTRAFGLVGVNGVDFVARAGLPYAIEVNPRYTAAMELVERAYGLSLFDVHVEACRGALPPFDLAGARRATPQAVGKAIVYARRPTALGDTRSWLLDPDVRDISPPGTRFAPREPICTIFARGRDAAACFATLTRRAARLYHDVERREAQSA